MPDTLTAPKAPPPLLPLLETDNLQRMTPTPESPRCDQPCALTCAEVCPLHAPAALPPIDLDDALQRFDREAVRGICDTGRYKMPYFVWGEGPPLVFIHGAMDSSKAWVMPIARLSAHFRCVAYDLPNGRDDGARLGRHSHADLVADFFSLLDHLQLAQLCLRLVVRLDHRPAGAARTSGTPAAGRSARRPGPAAVATAGTPPGGASAGSCRARPADCRCARR